MHGPTCSMTPVVIFILARNTGSNEPQGYILISHVASGIESGGGVRVAGATAAG